MEITNNYELRARIFPAFISMIPIFIFTYFFLDPQIPDFIDYILGIKIIGYLSLGSVFIYLFMHICRLVSKVYQKFYFKDELYMPTTNFMLYFNEKYTDDFKSRIRGKIETDFGIKLLSKEEELNNEQKARKLIAEAISRIRLKVKKGVLLLQHNIEYGFWRNFVGGSTVAVLLSLINIIIFLQDNIALILSIVTFCFYLLPIIFSKFIIDKLGENYAKILLEEYMSL